MRKIRKMRRRRTRRAVTTRRRRTMKASSKPEVKFLTMSINDIPLKIHATNGASALYTEQRMFANILGGIVQGTGASQRIGNKIFLKHITVCVLARGCPSANTYSVGTFYLRSVFHDTGGSIKDINVVINDFFRTVDKRNFNGIIDRSAYTIYADKTYRITAYEGPTWTYDDYYHNGPYRRFVTKHTFNKPITYEAGGNIVKDLKDNINYSLLLGVPGQIPVLNGRQIACADLHVTAYYTDS